MIIETGGGQAGGRTSPSGFVQRLSVGEQIGQSYPGDEDNGEMSAWYIYTLTNGNSADSDPTSWRLEGSPDGTTWTVLDERTNQSFPRRRQTRPFQVPNPGEYLEYRLTITASTGQPALSELELLA